MTAPGLTLYRAATRVLQPLAEPWLRSRVAKGKEDSARLGERLGRSDAVRPEGPLVWLHGASVGESLMLRALLEAIRRERPDIRFLVTTGTVTSAKLMTERLPDCAIHQYAPLDVIPAVRAFLDRWRPDLGVIAESELWPNLILEAKARGVKLALANARMTAESINRWSRRSPRSARALLDSFDWIGAADAPTAVGLTELSGRSVELLGNLKRAGDPPAADPARLAELKAVIGSRFVWAAASTHAGEDEIVLAAHTLIRAERRDALLLLIPRHPERGPAVAELARGAGLAVRRRAAGERLEAETAVYVADTLGEMGLWLRLASSVLVGGSLVPDVGGHNPLEPAMLGAPILTGPHVDNFAEVYNDLIGSNGAVRVQSAADIASEIRVLVGDVREARIRAAQAVAGGGDQVLEAVMEGLRPLLPGRGHG